MGVLRVVRRWCAVFALMAALGGWAGAGEALIRIAHLTDPQFGMGTSREDDMAQFTEAMAKVAAAKPDAVVICGDLSQRPNRDDWRFIKDELDKCGIPYFVAVGNHDVRIADKEAKRLDSKSLERFREVWGKDYDAKTVKGVKLLLVNSMIQLSNQPEEEKAAHDAFLAKELREAKAGKVPVIVVQHYPPFVAKADEPDSMWNYPAEARKNWLDLCVDNGVRFMLCGHTHRVAERKYKGMAMLNANTTSKNLDKSPLGFRELVVAPDLSYRWTFVPVVPAAKANPAEKAAK